MSRLRAVVLDAVGTLIRPRRPVAEVYFEAALRHGIDVSLQEIRERFPASWQLARWEPASEDHHRQEWHAVVERVFPKAGARLEPLFLDLWNHFGRPASWSVYPDVPDVWAQLTDRSLTIAIASNFDARLTELCRDLPPLDRCAHVFCSTTLGSAKPNPDFFRRVASLLGMPGESLVMVGDDVEQDIAAARRAGWQAIWLDRDRRGGQDPDRMVSLAELPARLAMAPIQVEFFGIPRERAGVALAKVQVPGQPPRLRDLLVVLAEQFPEFGATCVAGDQLMEGYLFVVQGRRFGRDADVPLEAHDSVFILSADAGG